MPLKFPHAFAIKFISLPHPNEMAGALVGGKPFIEWASFFLFNIGPPFDFDTTGGGIHTNQNTSRGKKNCEFLVKKNPVWKSF